MVTTADDLTRESPIHAQSITLLAIIIGWFMISYNRAITGMSTSTYIHCGSLPLLIPSSGRGIFRILYFLMGSFPLK